MIHGQAGKKSTKEKQAVVKKWLQNGSLNLFGLPFSGKDTQCKLLASWLGAPVIGGGDILRNNPNTPDHVRSLIDNGKLAPIDDYLSIITPYLCQPAFTGHPLVLSSLGRWHGEEKGILQAASDAGHPIKAVIFLELDEATVRQRWQKAQTLAHRGTRADDAEHLLDARLMEFRNKTLSVIDYYRQDNLLIEIKGHKTIRQVQSDILQQLYQKTLRINKLSG